MAEKPAVSLVAVPGRRKATLDLAQRLEREGFTGIYCPSPNDGLALCEALAVTTREIPLGTSIANIYTRGPAHGWLGIRPGKPLDDIRKLVADLRALDKPVGGLPPIALATLRQRMVALSAEIAQGAVWANGARSFMTTSLKALPETARRDPQFFIGDMVPTCIDDDVAAAAAVNRRTLTSYVKLPNYQNYWIEAGYEDEMRAIRAAIANRDDDAVRAAMSDRWLSDVTLYGAASKVRDGVEAWRATGVKTVIVVPSSARGNQMVAFEELFAAFR